MTSENHIVRRYQYELHNQFAPSGVRDSALLYLFGDSKEMLAAIAFRADGSELEVPEQHHDGHIAVQMHQRHLQPMIDMLRNEKPVYMSWSDATGILRISTDAEPVGEQELKRMFRFLYI